MSKEAYRISADIADQAFKAVEIAIDLLESAGAVFDEEDRKHSIPSASQNAAMRWQEAANQLEEVYETLKGVPRLKVLGSTATKITTIRDGIIVAEKEIG